MKTKRTILAFVCASAMIANGSLGTAAFAQDNKQDKQKQTEERTTVIQRDGRTITVQTTDGGTGTFNFQVSEPGGPEFRMPQGFGGVWVESSNRQSRDSVFQFFSQEMSFESRNVKDRQFSAKVISESIQTLADGNRIVQRTEGYIYRDSQGRTRNERTFQMGGSGEQKQTINIFDPVAGTSYSLDPATRIATRMNTFVVRAELSPSPAPAGAQVASPAEVPRKVTVSGGVLQGSALRKVQPPYPPIAKAAKAEGAVQVQVTINESGEVAEAQAVSGHPLLRDSAVEAARQWQFKPIEQSGKPVKVQGTLIFNFTLAKDSDAASQTVDVTRRITKISTNTEQLGKQTIEGVECEGKRETTTIPAGAIGNENPIMTVRESWYSPDLQMTILTRQSDPRFGESSYQVINISRSEPDASHFQVPSYYTIKEMTAPPPLPPPPVFIRKNGEK